MDWQPAPDALIDLIEEAIDQTVVEAKYTRLPFYEDGYLVDVETVDENAHVVLGGIHGLATAILDGSVEQIKTANEIAGLRLTRETVGEYARFFCDHLAGPDGLFRITESTEGRKLENGHPLRDLRIRVRHREPDGSFRVGAFHLYAEQLFRVSLRVHSSGWVEMVNDVNMGAFIGVTH